MTEISPWEVCDRKRAQSLGTSAQSLGTSAHSTGPEPDGYDGGP
jgi:hypothetical protein